MSPRRLGPITAIRDLWTLGSARAVVRRSMRNSIVVGTVLTALNQGHSILSGEFSATTLVRIAGTFLVPYAVTTLTAIESLREHTRRYDTASSRL